MSLRELATEIVSVLQKAGFEAYWVGGCVRDSLLGREPGDYDIATSARSEEIEALFPKTIPVGRKFGVILVVEQGHPFQVATFRAEADYQDGRRPETVSFSDAKEDALRRDFTVNGLFFDPVSNRIFDWVGGEADLQARVIRTIGDPEERFAEDHLRMLRAIRFAAQLGFEIEPRTFAVLREQAHKISRISAERIRDELLKLFMPPHAARGLDLLRESGLMEQVLPELMPTLTCEQSPPFHPEGSVYNHIRLMLEKLPAAASPSLVWSAILHDIGKPATASLDPKTSQWHFYEHEKVSEAIAENVLQRLRFPRKQIDEIAFCVRHHMQFKDVLKMRKATVRRLLLRPTFPLELELHRLDCLGSHGMLDHYEFLVQQQRELENQPEIRPPLINGRDLLEMGVEEGPAIGAILADVRELQLQGDITTREEALEHAAAKWSSMRPAARHDAGRE